MINIERNRDYEKKYYHWGAFDALGGKPAAGCEMFQSGQR